MAYNAIGGFPPQQLSFNKKGKKWRAKCVDFGDDHSGILYTREYTALSSDKLKT